MAEAIQSGIQSGLDAVWGIGLDILKTRGAQELAKYESREQANVQVPYAQLAASSPNLGPNDNTASVQQANFQAAMMNKINPASSGFSLPVVIALVAAIVALVFVFRRK